MKTFEQVKAALNGKIINLNLRYIGCKAQLRVERYATKVGGTSNTALLLDDPEDGCPIAVASVFIDSYGSLPADEIFVKDWSENEGMTKALIKAKVIHPLVLAKTSTGHVVANCYQLNTETPINEAKRPFRP